MKDRAVSLSFELNQIMDAVDGVRLLGSPLQQSVWSDPDGDRARIVAGVVGSLAMVVARLGAVIAVLRDEADPRTILAPHNAVPTDARQSDILVSQWSPKRTAEHARESLKLAENRLLRANFRGRR